MRTMAWLCDRVSSDGFAVVSGVLGLAQVHELLASLGHLDQNESVRNRGGVFAVRNLLDIVPEARDLAWFPSIRSLVTPILGESAFPVRGILFDKTPTANWKVPWHQDVTIAVEERIEMEGFGPWSTKAGVLHVQPPAGVLENMLSVRLHLDPCGAEHGALKVIPGSHRSGRLAEPESTRLAGSSQVTVCAVEAGDALLMRPLLLHSSSASRNPNHRRVLHFDYASSELPGGLRWVTEQ